MLWFLCNILLAIIIGNFVEAGYVSWWLGGLLLFVSVMFLRFIRVVSESEQEA